MILMICLKEIAPTSIPATSRRLFSASLSIALQSTNQAIRLAI